MQSFSTLMKSFVVGTVLLLLCVCVCVCACVCVCVCDVFGLCVPYDLYHIH